MGQITISKTTSMNLCSGCGVCAGICPQSCISWELKQGMYIPEIDIEKCVDCGLCAKVCPGLGHEYKNLGDAVATATGPVESCFNAWSKDEHIRHISASGGVTTALIRKLLADGLYDSVFCLDSYDYRQQLSTNRHTKTTFMCGDESGMTPKSRYLPVSHEKAVQYMLSHRNERIILVATSCALRGLSAVIQQKSLNRENYLLIGLFCDKIFNYNVITYFEDRFCDGHPLEKLHFKNKESGGWPGDMKLFPQGQKSQYISLNERAGAKKYFMPERCLYCVDKLNALADISLGDNYTGIASSEKGSNSVIIRTRRGQKAWAAVQEELELVEISAQNIQNAQVLIQRLKNACYGDMKTKKKLDLNREVQRVPATEKEYRMQLRQLRAGACYDQDKQILEKQMRNDKKKPNPIVFFVQRGWRFLCRRLLKRN